MPRIVPTMVANSAMVALTPTERQIVGSWQMFSQASRENSFQRVFVRPMGLLNEKSTTTATGRNM